MYISEEKVLKYLEQTLSTIQELQKKTDLGELALFAHRLRGNCAIFGVSEAFHIVEELDNLCNTAFPLYSTHIKDLLKHLESIYKNYLCQFSKTVAVG